MVKISFVNSWFKLVPFSTIVNTSYKYGANQQKSLICFLDEPKSLNLNMINTGNRSVPISVSWFIFYYPFHGS